MSETNPNTIFFLYEGDTEREFYNIIFKKHLSYRKIRLAYKNLKGITTNINRKISGAIIDHSEKHPERKNIHVFIAIDREGPRTLKPLIDIITLKKQFIKKDSQISSIHAIIATQDFESWLFFDIEGIFKFLGCNLKKCPIKTYSNVEKTNNRTLSQLFRKHGKTYFKGTRVHNFIKTLDIDKIYNNCNDLRKGIEKMKDLT
jgi:hypothetical protein